MMFDEFPDHINELQRCANCLRALERKDWKPGEIVVHLNGFVFCEPADPRDNRTATPERPLS
jgi:hypothetical protein